MILSKKAIPQALVQVPWLKEEKAMCMNNDPAYYVEALKYNDCYVLVYMVDDGNTMVEVITENMDECVNEAKKALNNKEVSLIYIYYQISEEEAENPDFELNKHRDPYYKDYYPEVYRRRIVMSDCFYKDKNNNIKFFKDWNAATQEINMEIMSGEGMTNESRS